MYQMVLSAVLVLEKKIYKPTDALLQRVRAGNGLGSTDG